ncbi:MAG: SDR family oxidoreductase [Planctomycetes bacterium]|nr:SDR family oxidoreductase [Planctomycetota bacterium]MBI3833229.1 SDR family oxidoreductase [Planctomycetota bacterium]
MSFLDLKDKTFLVMGVANKKSVAYQVASQLLEEGATVVGGVHSDARREAALRLLPSCDVFVCDVERDDQIADLAECVSRKHPKLHGIVHSIAFANYEGFSGKFHEVSRQDFLQCVSVSCFSLIALSHAFARILDRTASVVTISISTTRMAVESYGYMAPVKAALDSSIAMLAKSFSSNSEVRFNAVCAGPLKTQASAGIPGYLEHYLFAEQATLRKQGVTTTEVAAATLFLLSERSSGINAQGIIVDAGMSTNYFDQSIVKHTLQGVWPADSK